MGRQPGAAHDLGHWASSKARREWEAKGDVRARELLDLWKKDIPAQDWRNQHDLFAFGYGQFDGPDVGYVQTVRNPFPILLRTVPEQKQYDTTRTRINDRFPHNQMYFMVHLTGTGPAGVVKAVEAFMTQGLLNGILPGAIKPLQDEWSLEGLGPKQLAANLPAGRRPAACPRVCSTSVSRWPAVICMEDSARLPGSVRCAAGD